MVATVEQLAALVRGRVVGDGTVAIRSARSVDEAGPGDITFVESERFARQLKASPASAAIVGPHFRPPDGMTAIEVDDPITAFLTVRTHLGEAARPRWSGVHERAYVAPDAILGADVAIYPLAYVGDAAEVGEGSTIHPGAVVGEGCKLGKDVILHPNVVLYPGVVLGDRVEVHDDVEIGSNCTIDRGTFEATVIGEGSKIDNLVMIGHNNHIGRHNLLVSQVGIAGSCKTGDYVILAGQAGIKDHTEIGDRAIVGAQAGVHRSVPPGQHVLGSPAIPVREQRRVFQMIARLPDMHRTLRELAAQVAILAASPHAIDGHGEHDDPTGF
ncbi:MAG TPA: UDP-3-O-(3-hydroxymyristoyl)glucosamine N-acyltransferase [Thermoanaerobaculia bacterium]